MHTGHYISGAGHLALIGWMLLGGLLTPTPEPFELTEVSVITGAEFDAMIAASQPPQSVTEIAQPSTPEAPPETPEVTVEPDTPIEQPAPVQAETPPADSPPDLPQVEDPPAPEVTETPEDLRDPVGDVAVLVPEVAPEAAPRPIERVAPEPVAQPDPEAAPDTETQEAVTPDTAGEAPPEETQEATAPEEATTEIVTEATAAPAASPRPPGSRPAAPTRTAAAPVETETPSTPAETPATDTGEAVSNDDVLAALEAAQQAISAPAPTGPPLSSGEKSQLRAAIAKCWNVGALSTEAKQTTVIVALDMNQNATPVANSIRFVSASGGSDAAAQRVYNTARSAIIRCGSGGLPLPQDKYSQWQQIEITFDPSKMGF